MQPKFKRKNTQEITYFGLVWKKHKGDISVLRADDVIHRSKNGVGSSMKATCCLCRKPYSPDLMYIRCERCRNWFHGDALRLEEKRIVEIVSYRCCRCRRRAIPGCPHSDDYYYKSPELANSSSSEEAVGAADEDPSSASFGRSEQTVEETIHADCSVHMENFVPGNNHEMNFVADSSHPAGYEGHTCDKEPQPYDACFAWYTPGSGTRRRLDPVGNVRPPAPTAATKFDKDKTTTLRRAFGGFREIAAETGSLYERVRQGDYVTNDEIMSTLDKLQQISLHHMKNIACHDIVYPEPEAPAQPMHNASTSTMRPSDHRSSSRTPAP